MNEHTQSGIYDLAQTPSGEITRRIELLRHYQPFSAKMRPILCKIQSGKEVPMTSEPILLRMSPVQGQKR